MSVMGHYIYSPLDKPNDWELREEQLTFTPIDGQHNAINQLKILIKTIDCYGLQGKVGWFTADGAAVNGACLCEVEKSPE
jgi:hypothetical protein